MTDVDPAELKQQIVQFVPSKAQRLLAVAGVRDEAVFPIPAVLRAKPTLVAYYRLLLGVSQKRFYTVATGMSKFKRLEYGAPLTPALDERLPALCAAMCAALSELVYQAESSFESRDVEDLQLLTLGSYYYGSLNNKIGHIAILGVFNAIQKVMELVVHEQTRNSLQLRTSSGRRFLLEVASDPDIRIVELTENAEVPVVSMEVKGGTDKANAYNRGGEAEKSHQGARSRGYDVCWTIIHTANVDQEKLKQGSPSTTAWFDTNEVVGQSGEDWKRFQDALLSVLT